MQEFAPDRWICKLDVPRGGILSRVSGTYLKMATLENLVIILCKNPNLQTKLAKCGFVHALEIFLDFLLKMDFKSKCGFLYNKKPI